MWLFFVVFLVIWGGAHAYLAWSLGSSLHPRRKRVVWFGFTAHFVLGMVGLLMRNFPNFEPVYSAIKWIHYIGMGAFMLLFSVVLVKDLGWLLFRGAEKALGNDQDLVDESRRDFFKTSLNLGAASVTAVGTTWGFYQARRLPDVVDVTVPVADLPPELEGFRIVQLSDMHVGPTIRRPLVEHVVERVNELDADMVAITGDLIEGKVSHIWHDLEPIVDLKSRHGTYYCTGNHEYYWEAKPWCEALEKHGINVLNNAHRLIEHDGGRLLVAGCTDITAGQFEPDHTSDPAKAKEGAPDHDFSVILAHQPGSIHAAAEAEFGLQLSGHTHGGQFWPGNLLVGFFHPYAVGLHREDKTWIYISRGTGYWGPPMRLKAPSEITRVTLMRGGAERAEVIRHDKKEV